MKIRSVPAAIAQTRLIRLTLRELGAEQPLMVAHSWSAVAALALALRYPDDFAGLVLINPLCYADASIRATDPQVRVVSKLGSLVAPMVGRPAHDAALRAKFSPEPVPATETLVPLREAASIRRPSERRRLARNTAALRSAAGLVTRYGDIEMPVVIVVGDGDRVASPARHGFRLHNQVHHSHSDRDAERRSHDPAHASRLSDGEHPSGMVARARTGRSTPLAPRRAAKALSFPHADRHYAGQDRGARTTPRSIRSAA